MQMEPQQMMIMKKYIDNKKNVFLAFNRKLHTRIGMGILVFLILVVFLFGFYGWNLTPSDFGNKDLHVYKVVYGSSLRDIGQSLAKNHFIRNKLVFEIYVRLNPRNRMTKAGYYRISPGMSVPDIVRELRRGTAQSVRVTIPEGLDNLEMVDLLARKGLVNRTSLLNQLHDQNLLSNLIGHEEGISGTEGYLFPDTYNFELNSTVEKQIIQKMFLRFQEVFQKNFSQVSPDKRREIVIIASLVEKEAKKPEERPIIAGIFYNRLKLGYPLQSCATVEYSLGKHKERLYYKDLQVNSPYNTYLHQGLPPGPIANPGLASLKAAVFPAQVNYLYFVARPNGTHAFSTTYQQHLNAQRRIEKMSKQGT
jgi:UPF0755 protein